MHVASICQLAIVCALCAIPVGHQVIDCTIAVDTGSGSRLTMDLFIIIGFLFGFVFHSKHPGVTNALPILRMLNSNMMSDNARKALAM